MFIRCIADGPDEVRKAAREQMRQGADQVKLMVSGGVASPYDPLDSLQFSEAEISAAVEEAKAFGRYVLTHAYTPEAIGRAVRCLHLADDHTKLEDLYSVAPGILADHVWTHLKRDGSQIDVALYSQAIDAPDHR